MTMWPILRLSRATLRQCCALGIELTMKLTFGKPANAAVWNTLFTTTTYTS